MSGALCQHGKVEKRTFPLLSSPPQTVTHANNQR